ncbi:MAG: putative sulfate exporter family transporter [Acidobacteria bacterium]|nr:putative sulfate exporter family transporter [Acidobacteriota bacterium]
MNRWAQVGAVLPGLGLVAALTALCVWVHPFLPESAREIFGLTLMAISLGLLIGNLTEIPVSLRPGIRFSFQTLLKVAIVLLGCKVSFVKFQALGWSVLGLVLFLMTSILLLVHFMGRRVKVSDRLSVLLGVGTAVCGNTAISAAAPVIGATDEEVSFAIATNTLFGTLALFIYPFVAHLLGLTDPQFGIWAGSAINDTSQVVAAGFAYSAIAGEMATTVKLARNSLMGVVLVILSLRFGKTQSTHPLKRIFVGVPWFVWGFVGMAVLGYLGWIQKVSGLESLLGQAIKILIPMALLAVGLQTRFQNLKQLGVRPLMIGFVAGLFSAMVSLGLLIWADLGMG